jgi:class 3 adenylate cyclase
MGELPTGTVTLLFTDIEGSTKLLHELGDAYAAALDGHRVILRKAFADHGGAEVVRCSARRGSFALDRTGRCRSTRAID